MSDKFIGIMQYINTTLKKVYNAQGCVLVPGGGSFGMEAVARQFCNGQHCLVVRNGWFSYRWSDIFDKCQIPRSHTIMRARRIGPEADAPFAPCPVDEVCATIVRERPSVVLAPHVETSAGMIIPDDYIRKVSDAAHSVGAIFVLDCVASGCQWIDMEKVGADVLITAPQKGWSGTPCVGIIMLSARGIERMHNTTSSSFGVDIKKWYTIMQAYEKVCEIPYSFSHFLTPREVDTIPFPLFFLFYGQLWFHSRFPVFYNSLSLSLPLSFSQRT
jgi:aspartate aminotransferase-like enzyme